MFVCLLVGLLVGWLVAVVIRCRRSRRRRRCCGNSFVVIVVRRRRRCCHCWDLLLFVTACLALRLVVECCRRRFAW